VLPVLRSSPLAAVAALSGKLLISAAWDGIYVCVARAAAAAAPPESSPLVARRPRLLSVVALASVGRRSHSPARAPSSRVIALARHRRRF